ncbi:MAG TPA: hypothetical protein VKT80_00940, partial [Chloroflexota bacterium]|nr:hypothetical protein [Chloroflexota bacterium]
MIVGFAESPILVVRFTLEALLAESLFEPLDAGRVIRASGLMAQQTIVRATMIILAVLHPR